MIERAIETLTAYFTHVTVEPAAPDACDDLLDEDEAIQAIPDGLRTYLERCDGISVETHDPVRGELFGSDAMLEWQGSLVGKSIPASIVLPLATDGCGNYYIMLYRGPGTGAVFFLDSEPQKLTVVVASDVPRYVKLWADHLISTHEPDGTSRPYKPPPFFDDKWLAHHDSAALKVRRVARSLAYCELDS